MPSDDGVFTYHGLGLTPIHYRHSAAKPWDIEQPAAQGGGDNEDADGSGNLNTNYVSAGTRWEDGLCGGRTRVIRLGGVWEWSPDRVEWFSTSSVDITRGVFARGGSWKLGDANREIVHYLNIWPIQPFWRTSLHVEVAGGIDHEAWSSTHKALVHRNAELLASLEELLYTDSPTTPCVSTGSIVMLQHMAPPIVVHVAHHGEWTVHPPSEAGCGAVDGALSSVPMIIVTCEQPQLDLVEWCEGLAERRLCLPVVGPHGIVIRTVRVWEHCFEVFKCIREKLGILHAHVQL